MDEETRRDRELEALEAIAAEAEKKRMLKEHVLEARTGDEEVSLHARPAEEG
jgi:hypothetical protein